MTPPPRSTAPRPEDADPRVVAELIERFEASLQSWTTSGIAEVSGPDLVEHIRADIAEMAHLMFDPRNMAAILAGMQAAWALTDRLQEWLGQTYAVDVLTQSVPGNVTSQMGRALLDVSDVIRAHRDVVDLLARSCGDGFLEAYGMSCAGEIDITRPQWREQPSALLREVLRTGRIDATLIDERRRAHRGYAALTPPRVLTSDGEGLDGAFRRTDLPAGALPGLAVSAGVAEGRARVVADMAKAALEPGDILVTSFTDPSWTPVFVGIAGLVTEVGGLMTHGAVIAREYGLPAVVVVQRVTERIRDGPLIRVHGSDGYVEILGETTSSVRRVGGQPSTTSGAVLGCFEPPAGSTVMATRWPARRVLR